MRLGLIARADNGGLGIQTWEMYRHLSPAKTLVVDISQLTGYENHFDRYDGPGVEVVNGFPLAADIDRFLDDLDVVITCETPYSYYLFEAARLRGIKTVLQYNFEFLDYFQKPDLAQPDLFLAPTMWRFEDVPFENKMYLPVPINRALLPFKEKSQAYSFLHIAGHRTFEDRNGTDIVLAAIPLVKSDVQFVIRSQHDLPAIVDYRVRYETTEAKNYWEMYRDEDVLLLPRKYGGLSLQLNEALSQGMVPLMTDTTPQNKFLAIESLIEGEVTRKIMTRTAIDLYEVTPEALAKAIDELAGFGPNAFSRLSQYSNTLAEKWSWDTLKPEYLKMLGELCDQK